ncbi:hypothetical protein [Pseudomonas sp. SLFW]|uniref:hypothetical protein n=1 Tax=Pseudomonas sp. SLFW TaxID=2683259 RepID=UPI0014134179|nr:hypothetical protein [Pseudomonas sp. SLFW]NBB09568.1 hypothetical protein [Pseudomonas sp. SLFW]
MTVTARRLSKSISIAPQAAHTTSNALTRRKSKGSALKIKRFCCAAVGINGELRAAAKSLIPHLKLRRAAKYETTLGARIRPSAQPAQGYNAQSEDDQTTPASRGYTLSFGWRSITPLHWDAAHLCNETILEDMAQAWLLPDNVHHHMSLQDRRRSA